MSDYSHIANNTQMTAFLGRLKNRGVSTVATDLEGEFNLHVYGERFCLLQVYDGEEQVVIDPVTVSIDLIRQFLENRDVLKITYDCTSDRSLLFKAHGIRMRSILDLRPAVELLEYEKQDLKSVQEAALGVHAEGSKKRFQQYDWTRRPILPEAITYALQDVRHLFELKDTLLKQLTQRGLLEAYILENLKRQDRDPDVSRKPGIFRSGRHSRLSREQKALFERIYDIRESFARDLDLPPNTVMLNNDLFAIVTGELEAGRIRGNRRLPDERLQALQDQIRAALSR